MGIDQFGLFPYFYYLYMGPTGLDRILVGKYPSPAIVLSGLMIRTTIIAEGKVVPMFPQGENFGGSATVIRCAMRIAA